MNLRENGKLRYEKKGNAYLYFKEDVEKLMKEKRNNSNFPQHIKNTDHRQGI